VNDAIASQHVAVGGGGIDASIVNSEICRIAFCVLVGKGQAPATPASRSRRRSRATRWTMSKGEEADARVHAGSLARLGETSIARQENEGWRRRWKPRS